MRNAKQLLKGLDRKEKLASPALAELSAEGLINIADVTNMQSTEKEYLFIDFTEKGRKLLQGR